MTNSQPDFPITLLVEDRESEKFRRMQSAPSYEEWIAIRYFGVTQAIMIFEFQKGQ
jgi:hypothetical protein